MLVLIRIILIKKYFYIYFLYLIDILIDFKLIFDGNKNKYQYIK